MYGEMVPLMQLGPFSVTAYSLMMALAACLALTVTILVDRRKTDGIGTERAVTLVLLSTLMALVGGHLVYGLAFFPALDVDYGGYGFLLRLYEGGYTLFGAVFFVLLACVLLGRAWRIPSTRLMDSLAPGAALALCVGRVAEVFNGQGLGVTVEEEALQFFPYAVCTYMDADWAEWYLAVFVFEAAAALVMFCVLLVMLRRPRRDGYIAGLFLTMLCASQIYFEQHRADDCIRFGFVRLTQLCALAVMIGLLVIRTRRLVRGRGWKWEDGVRFIRFTAAALCVVFIEFAFEKPQFYPYLDACLILMVLCICLPCAVRVRRDAAMGQKILHIALCVASAAFAVFMIYILTLGLENEWDYLFAFMLVSLFVMAFDVCPRREDEGCIA